jgi:hypothetical protein
MEITRQKLIAVLRLRAMKSMPKSVFVKRHDGKIIRLLKWR